MSIKELEGVGEDEKMSMSMLKMPKKLAAFANKNPKIAEIIGSGLLSIYDLRNQIDKIEAIIYCADTLAPLIQDGTKEDLREFQAEAKKGDEFGIQTFNDLSKEELTAILEGLGDKVGAVTACGVN